MTEKDDRLAAQNQREKMEADLVKNRIEELRENPIKGKFDAVHLKAVHAHIFQDLPHHQPGVTRGDTPDWTKTRVLEGRTTGYAVPYAHEGIEARLTSLLDKFGGPNAIRGLAPAEAAKQLAAFYGDLDHAHAFHEGNSRTLREFTRELASEAGFKLDWTGTATGAKERNALYVARDLAVLERAYPELTPENAMVTNDRAEYEASFAIEGLRRAVGDRPLDVIISDGLIPTL